MSQAHVAIETRLTVDEREALIPFLHDMVTLIADGVLNVGPGIDREALASGLDKLGRAAHDAQPPFDDVDVEKAQVQR